ncbi:MAG: very short patch repair endonuclease [Phenylobacterium sp.]
MTGLGGRKTSGRDPLTPEQRRHNMSRIRGRDTKPELILRRSLHAAGLRYRLQGRGLPGRPDLVFAARHAVVFVHGCFWHGHDCPMFRLPATRAEFWSGKISGNRARDARTAAALADSGWRILTVWECALRGLARRPVEAVTAQAQAFLAGSAPGLEIEGDWPAARAAAQQG